MNMGVLLRTARYLKPIQVWARAWNKMPRRHSKSDPLPTRGVRPQSSFPRYYSCWDGGASFTFLHETHDIRTSADWNSPNRQKLWLYNLHYFDCLRGSDNPPADAVAGLLERWLAENPVGRGNGWEPYPISLRIVNWIKWLLSTDGMAVAADLRGRLERSLCVQTRSLRARLEYHLLANHLLANAKSLVFAGTFFDGSEAEGWLRKGLAIYKKQLPEQILADGVHFERSAMYHAIILEDLLDCFNLTGNALFVPWIRRMCAGLELLTGPDGRIVKFNDASEGIALAPAELQAYAERLGVGGAAEVSALPLQESSGHDSGIVRMEVGEYVALAKTGEIGSSYQPGHAHADTWTFELWKSGVKVVSDTGCSTYELGAVRSYERGTRAHNTVVVDGQNSSEVWASHRVGHRFDWCRHRREFKLTEEGLQGIDHIFVKGRHDIEIRFHLPPGVSKEDVVIECPGTLSWETCDFAEGWNVRKPGLCAVYSFEVTAPTKIEWSIR